MKKTRHDAVGISQAGLDQMVYGEVEKQNKGFVVLVFEPYLQ